MKLLRYGAVLILAASVVGCSSSAEKAQKAIETPIVVKAKTDPTANFNTYKTWSWVPRPLGAPMDPRIDDVELKKMVADAISREMFARGYAGVAFSDSTDLLVDVFATVQDIDANYVKQHYAGTYSPEYRTEIGGDKLSDEWTEGTLIIMVFDARTKQAVWGGSAQTEVFPDLSPEVRQERLNKGLKLLMESFPARNK